MLTTTILRGGLGNNLFCIATVLAYALKHGTDYAIPTKIENPHSENQEVFYTPNLKYTDKEYKEFRGIVKVYDEPFFHYKEIPKFDCEVLVLNGYFQSWRYIEPYKKEIIKLLDIGCEYKKGIVFLHLRLGDYKHLSKFHNIIDDNYIEKALAYFEDKGYWNFMVFSDEIDEAKRVINSEKYPGLKFEYSEGLPEEEDLYLMASCEGGIMSASSFSWWGAWLGQNENREIIYPANWFGENIKHDIKDLCPSTWISL